MANNKNGVLNKVLNFIGLVDDDTDTRSADYGSGSYGRQEPYHPDRQRNDRGAANRPHISEKGGRSNYGANTRRPRAEEQPQANRRPSRFEDAPQEPHGSARNRTRFEETNEQPARGSSRSPRSSDMLMLSLYTLYDTRAVIAALVKGHTINVCIEAKNETETQRITDTLSGAAFAVGGDLRQVGKSNTYMLTPKSVNILNSYDADNVY